MFMCFCLNQRYKCCHSQFIAGCLRIIAEDKVAWWICSSFNNPSLSHFYAVQLQQSFTIIYHHTVLFHPSKILAEFHGSLFAGISSSSHILWRFCKRLGIKDIVLCFTVIGTVFVAVLCLYPAVRGFKAIAKTLWDLIRTYWLWGHGGAVVSCCFLTA